MHLYDRQDHIYDTWKLLFCEPCGRAMVPPKFPQADLIADFDLRCSYCGEKLALLECITSGEHDSDWRPGMTHRYVATAGSLSR